VDVSDADQVNRFVRDSVGRMGGIDVLVNNAGVARDGVLPLVPDSDIDVMVDLNLKGTLHVTKQVCRHMLRQGSGRVINISSVVGLSGYRGLAVYSATKAALDGMTRALARELGSRGITVNSIAPGYLRTEMTHGLDEEQLQQIARRTPLGRLGEPEDVVVAVRFLAGPARFLTGHTLVVDGGLTA
jgi:3-oxoacyl-[acyl-carrier protein] reductase